MAVAFAREGADIVINYLNEHEDAEETARVVREAREQDVTHEHGLASRGTQMTPMAPAHETPFGARGLATHSGSGHA